jgi:hypothetical protein
MGQGDRPPGLADSTVAILNVMTQRLLLSEP